MAIYLTEKNFIVGDIKATAKILYFFFDRGDVSSKKNSDESFANLPREKKILLKLLTYAAHCADNASVHLVYLEPLVSTTDLTPQLRCMLTSEFCLLFVFPPIETFSITLEDNFMETLVGAAKRLICVDANLVGTTDAYIMRNDPEKTADLLAQYDFNKWCYNVDVLTTKKRGKHWLLDKPLVQSDAAITRSSLFGAITKYFKGCGDLCTLTTEELLEFFFHNVTDPTKHPSYNSYKLTVGNSPSSNFLEERTAHGTIIFTYDLEQMLNKDNFTLFENLPLLSYHNSSGTNFDTCAAEMIENDETPAQIEPFGLIWPHLKTYKRIVTEAVGTKGLSQLEALRVRMKLFESTVLLNANKMATEPARSIYTKLNTIMGKNGVFSLVALPGPKIDCFQSKFPDRIPKIADYMFLSLVFVTILGLGRLTQAFMTLVHIFHSTAPKWKTNKIMLVSHTRGGMGKTHTIKALMKLITINGLFGSISSFTDTVFKYSEMCIGKVMVMDDVGLSHSQQKNAKREDTMMAAQFKSLLDTGYTANIVTEKDTRTGNFKVSTKNMVFNTGFVWNTNTKESFSAALADRCIFIGCEPLVGNLQIRPETVVDQDIVKYNLSDRLSNAYIRHHFLQTLVFTSCPEDCSPSLKNFHFLNQVIAVLDKTFPTIKLDQSHLRSEFKLMDLIIGEALRVGILGVLDWWLPPWTIVPKIQPMDSCKDYIKKLDHARLQAFKYIDLGELLVEVMVQTKLNMPMATVEIAALHFNQSTAGVLEVVYKLISAAMASSGKTVFEKGIDALTGETLLIINNLSKITPKGLDQRALEMGKDLFFNNAGNQIRLIEELTPEIIKLNGFFAYELFKLMGKKTLQDIYHQCYELFEEQLAAHGTLSTITISGSERNILMFCAACGVLENEIYNNGDGVSVSAELWGLGTELYLKSVESESCFGVLSGKYRGIQLRQPISRDQFAGTAHAFLNSQISWFSVDFVKHHLMGLFGHSRCGMVPCGNKMNFYSADCPSTTAGWETEEAAAIYQKYCPALPYNAPAYICHTIGPNEPANMDPYLVEINETFPSCVTQALKHLELRYARKVSDINQSVTDRKRRHQIESDTGFNFKKILTENGQKLLEEMRLLKE